MSDRRKYDWDPMRPLDLEAEKSYPLDWQVATIKARDGRPGELAKLLRERRPVPEQTLEVLANILEVMEARKLGVLYGKPLYSDDDIRHVAAARDFHMREAEMPDYEERLEFVAKAHGLTTDVEGSHGQASKKAIYAGAEKASFRKLAKLLEQSGRDWQRLRHLFRKS